MFLYVCKQTFRKLCRKKTQEFTGLKKRNFRVLFWYENEHIRRVSNFHQCIFKSHNHSYKNIAKNICQHLLVRSSNGNTRTMCQYQTSLFKFTIITPEWRQWRSSGVFIANLEQIYYIVLVFLLSTLNKQIPAGDTTKKQKDVG